MKAAVLSIFMAVVAQYFGASEAFVPGAPSGAFVHGASATSSSRLHAKYNSMEEILALFPEDKPVLVNFYDANTEAAIKDDIFRAKSLLQDRATLVSIKQQDYPELAKLWDCVDKSPAMILFKDGSPVARLYEETHYLEIVAKFGQYCKETA